MTIQQTIDIPADRHLRLDLTLPESFSAGQGEIILLDSVAKAQKTFKSMPTIAELKKEVEEQAERRRTDPVYRMQVMADLRKCQENGPYFGGMDGDEFQRIARDEWGD
jgi:hypothetical protein